MAVGLQKFHRCQSRCQMGEHEIHHKRLRVGIPIESPRAISQPNSAVQSAKIGVFMFKTTALSLIALCSVISINAHASQTLEPQADQYYAALSLTEKIQMISDKQIGVIKVASIDNGSAANPVSIAIMLESADQGGDNVSFDVYTVPGSYNAAAKTAKIVGDSLVITTEQEVESRHSSGWKNIAKTISIKIKGNGKRLKAPVALNY